jgi:tetratricopeptide (TPR) repeat protein
VYLHGIATNTLIRKSKMKQLRGILLASLLAVFWPGLSGLLLAQEASTSPDPKSLLAKAQAEIEKNPKSAFWHNQASVAYDALGDFQSAVKELQAASTLDPDDPAHEYSLYALYKRKGMLRQQRQALLKALELDGKNPLGRFELGVVLEKEGYLDTSLKAYRIAKVDVAEVKGSRYTDRRGGAYDVEFVRKNVGEYVDRLTKLVAAKQREGDKR